MTTLYRTPFSRILIWPLRLGLAGIFLYAGATKVIGWQETLTGIASYDLVPPRAAVLLALLLPWLEVLLGACLVVGVHALSASALAALMLTAFAIAQTTALSRGLTIGCGCFGGDESGLVNGYSVARTLVLLCCAVMLCYLQVVRHREAMRMEVVP